MKMQEKIPDIDRLEDVKEEQRKVPMFATQRGQMFSAFIFVGIIIVFMAFRLSGSGDIDYQMDSERIGIAFQRYDTVFIPYDTIEFAEIVNSISIVRQINGPEWNEGWCGEYESEELGNIKMFAYSTTGNFIVIHSKEGVLVFNAKSEKKTIQAYEELTLHMKKNGIAGQGVIQ